MSQNSRTSAARRRRPKQWLAAFGATFGVVTLLSPFVIDAHESIRFPYLDKLAVAYSRCEGTPIVAVGSSRTWGSFDVNLMNRLLAERLPGERLAPFNAAVAAGGIHTQEKVLRRLLEVGPTPRLVLVEVAPEMLHVTGRWIKVTRDVTWSDLPEIWQDVIRAKGGAGVVENRLLPIYATRFGLRRVAWQWAHDRLGISAEKLDPLEPDVPRLGDGDPGLMPPKPPATPELLERQRRASPPPLRKYAANGVGARSLGRIVELCESVGVPLMLVEAPSTTAFRQAQEPAQPAYRMFLAELMQRHPGVRYCDFTATIPDAAFWDEHHVNAYGKHVVCRRLVDAIIPEALAVH
nr:hypothetical protein Hi04_10k_c2220_00039 [uncultured bacterium]